MGKDDGGVLDQRIQAFGRYLEAEVCQLQNGLDQQLRIVAEEKIALVRANMEAGLKKAGEQYEAEMTKADVMAENASLSFLAEKMRESAKRQLDTTIQGYKSIAEQAIGVIRSLAR